MVDGLGGTGGSSTPTTVAPVANVLLRNLTAAVVSGADAAALETALQALLDAGGTTGNGVFVSVTRVADYKVLVIYAE